MKKEFSLLFATLLVTLLLVAGIGELVLRIRYGTTSLPREVGGGLPAHLVIPDKNMGHTLTPGFRGWQLVPGRPNIELKINQQGLRDYERELPSSAKAIIVLGDSYAFGHGVAFEEIWPTLLENKIRAAANQYYVIKGGIPAASWRQYYQQYKRLVGLTERLDLVHPLVIVTFTVDGGERITHGYTTKGGILVRKNHPHLVVLDGLVFVKISHHEWINRVDAFLRSHSYFFRWFNQRIGFFYHNLKRAIHQSLMNPIGRAKAREAERPRWQPELTMKQAVTILNSISELAKTHGARTLVLFVDYPNGRVNEIAFYEKALSQKGIPSLDLSKYEGASHLSWRLPKDCHYNELGNREIAETVFQFIREKKLLESIN